MAKKAPQRNTTQKGKVVYRSKPSKSFVVYTRNASLAEKALVDARETIQKRNDLLFHIIHSK